MLRLRLPFLFVLLLLCSVPSLAQYRRVYPIPSPGVPASLGVNIHFTDPRPGEMEQLAAAGFKWIRMDFTWGSIERTRGQYDFSRYEHLMASLKAHQIRPIFILDYGNDLYQQGSPRSEESRAAFARFAAASVTHFKGQGVLWEMWNEPNGDFWKPKSNVDEYIALALATGKAIRAAAPDEWYIGPGVSGMDFPFIEACFRAGLLEYWDAVSFHPYRNIAPETAAPDFLRLRAMITRYAGSGKQVPILSSEWGYSEKYPGLDLEKQSKYIVRQALSNIASGLGVSIWYDWHDDGVDPNEPEHHFGTVYNDYKPKPTYKAIQTLSKALADCRYNKRLSLGNASDYCLLFTSPGGPKLALWTTDMKPHTVRVPCSAGSFHVQSYLGAASEVKADESGLAVALTDTPQYLTPTGENALLGAASRWNAPVAASASSPAGALTSLRHVTDGNWTASDRSLATGLQITFPAAPGKGLNVIGPVLTDPALASMSLEKFMRDAPLLYNSEAPIPLRVSLLTTSGQALTQELLLINPHPLRIIPQPAAGDQVAIRIENPTESLFEGRIRLSSEPESSAKRLVFNQGQSEQTVSLPLHTDGRGSYRIGVRVERQFKGSGWTAVATLPEVEYRPIDNLAGYPVGSAPPDGDFRVLPDGDPKVKSTITAKIVNAPEAVSGLPSKAIRVDYDFEPGWKFLRLEPENQKRAALEGKPQAFGAWVYGDASGDILNARFTDTLGQTFQPTAGKIDWKGWRFVSFPLTGENSGHWGGPADGVIHYPIHLDTLLLVDAPGRQGGKGTIYATGFTLMSAPGT